MESVKFSDPWKNPEQQFELYFRKDLPRLVMKCPGQCGKSIRPVDDGLLVRSCGTSSWMDRKNGVSKSKCGKMYIHFNQKCFEAFDSKNFYGTDRHFDFKRVAVDKPTQEEVTKAERDLLIQFEVAFL